MLTETLEIIEETKLPTPVISPVAEPPRESFCTDWKCINQRVKLVTLDGDTVTVKVINDLTN